MNPRQRVHATCVAINGRGVLLRGKPGAGKSDLALRLIDTPGYGLGPELLRAELIADDQVMLEQVAGVLLASCPNPIKHRLEIRGLGIVDRMSGGPVPLALVVDLVPGLAVERLPADSDRSTSLLEVRLPRLALDPFTASAPAKIRAALSLSA
ncbi:MAG TPA: HPr kinase/phosphatase C-terminal domain-containing protein [Aestuariivirga sp.]|nr:HPr kinase/phosphatase C-terminal domain-containing protein [Aestuariivirga sp.]